MSELKIGDKVQTGKCIGMVFLPYFINSVQIRSKIGNITKLCESI